MDELEVQAELCSWEMSLSYLGVEATPDLWYPTPFASCCRCCGSATLTWLCSSAQWSWLYLGSAFHSVPVSHILYLEVGLCGPSEWLLK